MRRALVLTDEFARHPFRAGLPHHVRTEPVSVDPPSRAWSMQDLRDFLLAYCACFMAVSAFIL